MGRTLRRLRLGEAQQRCSLVRRDAGVRARYQLRVVRTNLRRTAPRSGQSIPPQPLMWQKQFKSLLVWYFRWKRILLVMLASSTPSVKAGAC